MHTLKNHLALGPLHRQHAFIAQHARTVDIHNRAQKVLQLRGVKGALRLEDKALDVVVLRMMMTGTMLVRRMIAMLTRRVIMVSVVAILFLEKVGINVKFGIEVKAAQVKHLTQRHFAEMNGFLRRTRVHMRQAMPQRRHFIRRHQIGLADEDLVGKTDLAPRLLAFIELRLRVLGVDQRQDRIQQVTLGNFVVHEEGLRHRAGIGHTSGFDHDAVKAEFTLAPLLSQVAQCGTQVFADGAADAAIAHLDDLLLGVRYQNVAVDVFLAKLVLDHGNLLPVRLLQHALEQRGFARAEKARQNRCRNEIGRHVRRIGEIVKQGSLAVYCVRLVCA